MDRVRIGIYGGSFDPVHVGHIAAAEAALRARGLDRVDLTPAATPPHKDDGCEASFEHRVAMARLAVQGVDRLAVSDLEGRRAGPSYTIDTVEAMGGELDLLVGADMLADLPRWHRAADLVAAVTVVGFGRPGVDLREAADRFRAAFGPDRLVLLDFEAEKASSTEARRRLREGLSTDGILDPRVNAYILVKRLYGAQEGG